jgi:3alpha(or 20beta)-hydroxysteroid dehydrogenase
MSDFNFIDETVLITGGARGMGASHVRGFAEQGARVIVADVLEDEGRALAAELGQQRASFVRLDVTSPSDWAAGIEAAETASGSIGVLVNNAGIQRFESIEDGDLETWRRVVDINLLGPYLGMRAVIPSMRKAGGGAIINISSIMGLMASPMNAAYVASKWGLRGLTKAAALELGRDAIRVISVHPGLVKTPMVAESDQPPSMDGVAIARAADPEEVTQLVLFAASEKASYITGSELVIDGGLHVGKAQQAGQGTGGS